MPDSKSPIKKGVLFVCIHSIRCHGLARGSMPRAGGNSARSQMAEEILRKLSPDKFQPESAGINPGNLNPLAIEVLNEIGIDISGKQTKAVEDLFRAGKVFDYVITVCDETQAEKCPVFPGIKGQLHWGFEDPSGFTGTHEEKLAKTRAVRDEIENKIKEWLLELN